MVRWPPLVFPQRSFYLQPELDIFPSSPRVSLNLRMPRWTCARLTKRTPYSVTAADHVRLRIRRGSLNLGPQSSLVCALHIMEYPSWQ
jgi:hypothetical protein